MLASPAVLLTAALAVHAAGRIAAFCSPIKVDSFVYALAAYKLYDAEVTIDDLVPDKPPGQALLTGWIYRVLPGPPSRMPLIPIESAFMLAGYLVFYWLTAKWSGRRLAAVLTLCVVIAHNTYNALDNATDGFNLGENYLLLPMMLAVYAQCMFKPGAAQGLGRGIGLGLALSIKQTAGGLLIALVLHDLYLMVDRRSWASTARLAGWTALGILVGLLPVAGFLLWRGWLVVHLGQLVRYSGGHMSWMPVDLPPGLNLLPVIPLLWLGGVGLMLRLAGRRSADLTFDAGERNSPGVFVALWLAVELAILWAMSKPCLHYYQQIVVPAALAAGLVIGRPWPRSAAGPLAVARAGRWLYMACAVLVLRAAMPVVAEASKRAHRFDKQAEIGQFERWMKTWSPADAALYGPRKERR